MLKNPFKKSKDTADKTKTEQPETTAPNEAVNPTEELLGNNVKKAMKVAIEVNRLRSRLPALMKDFAPEEMQAVNEQLGQIENALKGAKVATADLGSNDEMAIEVITNMDCLLTNKDQEVYRDEGIEYLHSALTEDWFQTDGMSRLQRKLALVMALEGKIKAEIDELRLMKEIEENKAKLKSLMEKFESEGDDLSLNSEIVLLKNRIEFMKNHLADTRAQRLEENNLYELARSSLKKLPAHVNPAFAEVYESLEKEQTEQLTETIERVKKLNEKLIENKVKLEMASEELERQQIAVTPEMVRDIHELIRESTSAQKDQVQAETEKPVQTETEMEAEI